MDCPRCKSQLKLVKVTNVDLEQCANCKGIFFDNFELKKFDEPHESPSEKIILENSSSAAVLKDSPKKISCPKCSNIKMMTRFYSVKQKIEIDECGACGGIWVDAGELAEIRAEFSTEEARDTATAKFVSFTTERPMEESQAVLEKELAILKRIGRVLHFIFPDSPNVPDKK